MFGGGDLLFGLGVVIQLHRGLRALQQGLGSGDLAAQSGCRAQGLAQSVVEDLGAEPQTQAEVYGLNKADYELEVTGTGSLRALEADESAMPEPQAIAPKINDRMYWILGLSLFALSLGFVTLLKRA